MNKKVWVRGFVFISFFLLVSCSLSIYAQDEDVDTIVEEEEDIFYEVEDEEFLEEMVEEEEIESGEGESLQPFKEVEEKEEVTTTEKKEDTSVQEEAEAETEEKPLVKTESEEMEVEETEVEETEVEEMVEKTAEPETMDEGEEEKHYTIRTWNFDRDCLWNIADHFYKNPWEWQKIWKANSYIENPDLIYEGDELVIPGVTGAVVEELKLRERAIVEEEPVFRKTEETGGGKDVASVDESVLPEKEEEEEEEFLREEISTLPSPVEEEEIEEVEEQVVVAKAGDYEDKEDTFIAPSDWEYDGIIIRAKERKMLLSAYSDFVFIDCGRDKGVVYGMRFNIYRKGKTVKHPRTKKVLGIKMEKVGVLEVKQDIQEDNATAQIINAREPIKIGDLIKIQQ